jgi:hypothetical protein
MLASFGLMLGEYDATSGGFPALADADALARLAPFANDFPHALYARNVDIDDMRLRPGMGAEDLRAEAAFVAYRLATDGPSHARRWRMAASAVQAMADSLDHDRDPAKRRLTGDKVTSLMRLNGKTISTLAQAMGITQTRVREVRDRGVQGEGYVLDWVEALHASEHAEHRQNRALADFIACLHEANQRQEQEFAGNLGAAMTEGTRVDRIQQRQAAFADAICTAKAADFEACGKDIALRLALMRKPDVVLLTEAMVREWVALEQGEFLALQDPHQREDAATVLMSVIADNPDFCAVLNQEYRHVAALVREYSDAAAHRVALREASKEGRDIVDFQPVRPPAEFTVLARTESDRRRVATFASLADAIASFQAASPAQRPYLLANGEMVLYRAPETDRITLTATCPPAMQQAYDQRKDASASALSLAVREGVLRTAVVLHSPEQGVYLGEAMGLAFWSALESADQPSAPTFVSVADAQQYLASWNSPPPADLQFVWVEPEPRGQYASMDACVRAGLPKWELSQYALEDTSPALS